MKKLITIIMVVLATLLNAQNSIKKSKDALGIITDEDAGWTLSIGANYRGMGQVNLDALGTPPGGFIDGSVSDFGGGLTLITVIDPLKQVSGTNIDLVTLSSVRSNSRTSGLDPGVGVALRAEKGVVKNGEWSLYQVISLTTAWVDTGDYVGVEVESRQYDTGQNWNETPDENGVIPTPPVPPSTPLPDKNSSVVSNNSYTETVVSNAVFSNNYDIDLGYYTIGLGVASTYNNEAFRCYVGVGPALTIAEYDVESINSGVWTDGTGTFVTEKVDGSDTKCRAGLYAEIGMEYGISEKWGFGISGRYDWIPVDLNTEIGEIELSGLSAQLSVTYRF